VDAYGIFLNCTRYERGLDAAVWKWIVKLRGEDECGFIEEAEEALSGRRPKMNYQRITTKIKEVKNVYRTALNHH